MSNDYPSTSTAEPGSDLAGRIATFRKSWWIVALVTALAVASAWYLTSKQERVYQASAEVLLRTEFNASLFPLGGADQGDISRYPNIEKSFVDENSFRTEAKERQPAGVAVVTRDDYETGTLLFTATGPVPADVAAAANLWADLYLEERQADKIAENQTSIDFVDETLVDLADRRASIRSDILFIDRRLEIEDDSAEFSRLLNQKLLLEEQIADELAPVEAQIVVLNAQLADLQLLQRVLADDGISARISDPAGVPSSPVSPNPVRNLATAAMLGLILGSGLVYLRTSLDSKVDGDAGIVESTGLPILASIPRYTVGKESSIEVLANPTSEASERYRSLVTALEFAAQAEPIASLLITSPQPGDGKSTTVVNLATLASVHMNVLVIGADLRRPTIHTAVGAENTVGLSSILAETSEFDDVKIKIEHPDGAFDLLTSGQPMADPTPLLRGEKWRTLIDKLVGRYDLVLIDGPPVLPVTDALLLGRHATTQLIVARSGTRRKDLVDTVARLESTGTPIVGVLVNQDRSVSNRGYRYQYAAD